jgi:hypothetical protein
LKIIVKHAGPRATLVRIADSAGGGDKDYKVENRKIVDVSLIEDKYNEPKATSRNPCIHT